MTTPPFASVGISAASTGTTFIRSSVGDEPFDDADLNVLEDVRRVAVHRVRLAIVADDEQIVRRTVTPRARSRRAARRRAQRRRERAPHAARSVIMFGARAGPESTRNRAARRGIACSEKLRPSRARIRSRSSRMPLRAEPVHERACREHRALHDFGVRRGGGHSDTRRRRRRRRRRTTARRMKAKIHDGASELAHARMLFGHQLERRQKLRALPSGRSHSTPSLPPSTHRRTCRCDSRSPRRRSFRHATRTGGTHASSARGDRRRRGARRGSA